MTSFPFARACLLVGVFALAACPEGQPAPMDTDSVGTDATAGSDATTDMTTTGSTETTETTTPTSTDGATDPSTDGTTTGGGIAPELDAACQSLCEKFVACEAVPDLPDDESCKEFCVSDVPSERCVAPMAALYQCISEMTCEELQAEEWVSCTAEEEALPEACAAPDCLSLDSSEGPGSCTYGYDCPDTGVQLIVCEGDTCTCLVDGESTGTCGTPEEFCDLDPDEKDARAFECCGFEF